jgi:nitric oxide dioxygenase
MLTEKTIKIVKSTAPIIKENGVEITTKMYEKLFTKYPEIQELFKNAPESQPQKLANAIFAYASNIDNLEALEKTIMNIAEKHVETNVKPEHYPLVKECLMEAVSEVLNPSEDVAKAWEEAYDFLAKTLVKIEENLYQRIY